MYVQYYVMLFYVIVQIVKAIL